MKDIIMVPIKEVHPYPNNPRVNKDAVDKVAASLKEFGFRQPIVINKDYVIICGHTRLEAAKRLRMKEVPVLVADDLSEEQVKAYRLADNKTAEFSEWDEDLLNIELDGILDLDMEQFGFDLDFGDDEGPVTDVEEADFSENVEPRCKMGDIWQLGRHRLICGDSTNVNVIDRLMDGVKADMVFTDPPYGMSLDTDYSGMVSETFSNEKHTKNGNKYERGKVDEFHPEMIDAVFTIDADEMFLWGADYFAELLPNKNDGSWIVWDKRANGNDDIAEDYSSDKMYGSCFELCWSKKKHKRDIARVKWAGVFGTEQEFDHKRYHPTQKPIKLAGWFLDRYSKEGQVIIDLFGGSGSTLIACEQLNKKCYICELDSHYCDVIINRWEQLTGQEAVLLNGGNNNG